MKQKLITPPIEKCICGNTATALDWDDNFQWIVFCDGTCKWQFRYLGRNATRHRAICKWNNLMIKTRNELNKGKEQFLKSTNKNLI